MSEPRPQKRHVALAPLSRDHHGGLVQARRLLQSVAGDAEARRAALASFAEAWQGEIAVHFADEEELLLPTLIADAALRRELVLQHESLRRLAARAETDVEAAEPPPSTLASLGKMLEDHIRWEERVLFPAIEQASSPRALATLQQETEAREQERPRLGRA